MPDEIIYRLIAGEGIQITEDSGTKTATLSVPSLSTKLNVGDIGQASVLAAGIVELATNAEVQALADDSRVITPGGLASVIAAQYEGTGNLLLKTGAFGLGAQSLDFIADLNNRSYKNGWYVHAGPDGGLNGPNPSYYGVVRIDAYEPGDSGSSWTFQTYYSTGSGVWWRSNINGIGWTSWFRCWDSSNFDPTTKANTAGNYPGLNVGNAATVGGWTAQQLVPAGAIMQFAMESIPSGWLKANGATVSRTTFSTLFAAIGTTWGAGNGSTTFNLPDLRGEFIRAWDDARGVDPGRILGTVQGSQNLSHTHTAGAVGDHTHQFFAGVNGGGGNAQPAGGAFNPNATSTTAGGGAHTHAIGADGGGEARPRNVSLAYCIKY